LALSRLYRHNEAVQGMLRVFFVVLFVAS
jgi:hypothetical protein